LRTKGKIGLIVNGRHESESGIVNTGKVKRVGQKDVKKCSRIEKSVIE